MLVLTVTVYAMAMTLANLSVAAFGPAISPVNSFFLIGLDLALRDLLHTKLNQKQMFCLILVTGALTYVLNPKAGVIAVASACAFTFAALTDWAVFSKARGSWFKRSNTSNVAGAAVDSFVFPTMAFGTLMPHIVAMQFVAKVAGGAFWAYVIQKINAYALVQNERSSSSL